MIRIQPHVVPQRGFRYWRYIDHLRVGIVLILGGVVLVIARGVVVNGCAVVGRIIVRRGILIRQTRYIAGTADLSRVGHTARYSRTHREDNVAGGALARWQTGNHAVERRFAATRRPGTIVQGQPRWDVIRHLDIGRIHVTLVVDRHREGHTATRRYVGRLTRSQLLHQRQVKHRSWVHINHLRVGIVLILRGVVLMIARGVVVNGCTVVGRIIVRRRVLIRQTRYIAGTADLSRVGHTARYSRTYREDNVAGGALARWQAGNQAVERRFATTRRPGTIVQGQPRWDVVGHLHVGRIHVALVVDRDSEGHTATRCYVGRLTRSQFLHQRQVKHLYRNQARIDG